ncbi:MAG: CHAD domain-containing protein [Solirubrobacterales bacterium]|nr:CHAD domain-containing protein [Solirubrobacterales bacterium]
MAKAAEIVVDPFESFAAAGARIVAVRGRELFEHADGVLDTSDIERVHAMRVASRRLRAVLEIFAACFDRDAYRGVLTDVKKLADALGERRDPDVHIDAMSAFAAAIGAQQRRGVQTLTEQLRERQAAGNEILASALEAAERSDLSGRLQRLAETALVLVPGPEWVAPEPGEEPASEPEA